MVQLMGSSNGHRMLQRMQAVFSDDEDSEPGSSILKPLPPVPENRGPPSILLATLLDFAVQKIYHELTVLSELLPKKMDADRKISIVQFAHSTRLLFIKLLAVVKWVKTSRKIESCTAISYFLEQQAAYFVETADKLVSLARDELFHAKMPAFQIPAAVDVLTLGRYPRLPVCIKSRFVSDRAITDREQASVLRRLNQVIEHRIASNAKSLPPRIKHVIIRNGMVTMTVPGEFEVALTLLGELASTPWTLLNIKILVEDYDIGYGSDLVHPLQINFLHQVAQSRMSACTRPINELYAVLHSFAQSLQLDLLYCQTTALIAQRMREHVRIDRYEQKNQLIISYWIPKKSASSKNNSNSTSNWHFQVIVRCDSTNVNSGLQVRHRPPTCLDKLPDLDDGSGRLCIERLLTETMMVRCRQRLTQLKGILEEWTGVKAAFTGDAVPSLTVPLLDKGTSETAELLSVAIHMLSGRVISRLPALGKCNELQEFNERLGNATSSDTLLINCIDRLRVKLMMERCKKSVCLLPIRLIDEWQLLAHSKLLTMPKDRLCFQFVKEDAYYLILAFSADRVHGVKIDFYLLSAVKTKSNLVHLQPSQMVLSSSAVTTESLDEPPRKKQKRWLGNAVELAAAVSTIDDRIAFMRIRDELDKRCVRYRQIGTEPFVSALKLRILRSEMLKRRVSFVFC